MNPNCFHHSGPSGVKIATRRIRKILEEENPNYIIRADIKGFYSSIPHYKLVQDIKKVYGDSRLTAILERIISNPIETPREYKNPITGIALRGPLSQFFSGLYLKPLDDTFSKMNVHYLRYNDDLIIFCKTKRQLNRCRRKMMEILHKRSLKLSRKKTRIGCIKSGFHFLGIHYPGTQPLDYINTARFCDDLISENTCDSNLLLNGENRLNPVQQLNHQQNVSINIVPHPRTLRRAREYIKCMVADGVSTAKIKKYIYLWAVWWVRTSDVWQYEMLLYWFINSCRKNNPAAETQQDYFRIVILNL